MSPVVATSYIRRCERTISEPANFDGSASDSQILVGRYDQPLFDASTAFSQSFETTQSRQEEDSNDEYFPPAELWTKPTTPNAGLHSLVVGNLDPMMTTERLSSMFSTLKGFMPSFLSADIMVHPQTHESLGYAMVYFEDERDQQ